MQPLATYEPFFGFSESPFSLAPDPKFLFASASHSAALAQVAHALERREPLVVITGDIGTGKTLLCRTVLQRLPFKTFLSVIHDPLLESDDLVKELLKDFGVIAKDPARFGGATRTTASLLFLLTRVLADGLRLFLAATVLQVITGWPIDAAILAVGLTTIVYTYLGGMKAVIWIDVIQFHIYIIGALIALAILAGKLPGGWA